MKHVLLALPIVAALATSVVYVESKASGSRVDDLEQRLSAAEVARARMDVDLGWIKSALWALTQQAGVLVPPPPGGTP
jgi:hypothetical protein